MNTASCLKRGMLLQLSEILRCDFVHHHHHDFRVYVLKKNVHDELEEHEVQKKNRVQEQPNKIRSPSGWMKNF